MKFVEGDLIKLLDDGEFDVIVHGCNCFHQMGAGIAGSIADKWPAVPMIDRQMSAKGDKFKLGFYTLCDVNYDNLSMDMKLVVNMYTQYYPGREDPDVLYKSISNGFQRLHNSKLLDEKTRIGIPKIGAGIAGGNWVKIKALIEKAMPGRDITLVVLPEVKHV